jgi:hypothetical protein
MSVSDPSRVAVNLTRALAAAEDGSAYGASAKRLRHFGSDDPAAEVPGRGRPRRQQRAVSFASTTC